MKTEIIPASSTEAIPRALEILKAGGLVAFPTDTVYGVGALGISMEKQLNQFTLQKIVPLKKRSLF